MTDRRPAFLKPADDTDLFTAEREAQIDDQVSRRSHFL